MTGILVFAVMLLLAGCQDVVQQFETIERAVIQPVMNDGKVIAEEIMISDVQELEDIWYYLSQTNWQPNTEHKMPSREDVLLRLVVELEQNMPERIDDYRIWFEQDNSMTILSNVKSEGYGRLEAKSGKPFKELLQLKITDNVRVIDLHGQLKNEELFEQFLKDVEENKQSTLEMTRYTVEGAPIYWTVTFNGHFFEIEIDNREDIWGSKNIENYQCEKLKQYEMGSLLDFNFTACEGDYEINLLSIIIE